MKNFKYKVTLVMLLVATAVFAQQTPAPKQTEAVTIVGATAHLGNGKVIANSLIIFEDGKLTQVLDALTTKMQYRGNVINAEGKHVYPGFIAPNSTLGLVEISSVRATDDEDEIGDMLPHVRSLIAYNAESKIVESMRPNGVLIGQITPRGSTIACTSSIVQFDAWNWEDAVIKKDDGIHLNWPNSFTSGRWWEGEPRGMKPNKEYPVEVAEITSFFKNSRAYLAGGQNAIHLPYKAMGPVFDGTKKVFVHVDGEKEILDAIQFKKEQNLENFVIVGGNDAHKVADQLRENNIPVLSKRPHTTPDQDDDDYDFSYKSARLLVEKGVLVGLESSGAMETMNTRNLPFYAGTVAASGLDKEEALKLITSNTAKILGIDNIVGTLEAGKDATLFISEGDALDMRGNVLVKAWIQGREISLDSHQTELYERYSNKYQSKKK
ncbi:amidohydrolase family protein [Antarcticibacterium sp. 1MA-6-2]|uniref:amidohydrolase family protein n=1 Tax=Antarcticibacterium sp. 1MA-6-2 TaxID=2908210 RepID=UPI001F3093A3|nr:amidohydrolase family protein [Antarcticibacterium sp. 1MA-6-2]UJH92121.1 amidohydrolase family protein [Antarcticibacterium sp. 1MA-6-2]